jgi:predicted RecB family nuclease
VAAYDLGLKHRHPLDLGLNTGWRPRYTCERRGATGNGRNHRYMIIVGGQLHLSATDLAAHLNCRHLTNLEVDVAHGALRRPHYYDPSLEALWQRGELHEADYVQHLTETGLQVVRIEGKGVTPAMMAETLAAMRSGADVIVQAALQDGIWRGRADILLRVPTPSSLGNWSYEAIDTKLAQETKGATVLQLCLYSELLGVAQGRMPDQMHVVVPGSQFEPQTFRTAAYAAYYRSVKRGLEQSLAHRAGVTTYPEPQVHCDICIWRQQCDARRRKDDHLCLVAGITKIQMSELRERGVSTATALAQIPVPLQWKPDRGVRQSYERVREQARVQVQSRASGQPIYELIAPAAGVGLALLPDPSPGDIFLDLEGDPFVGEGGLEYLFGYVSHGDDGQPVYTHEWALSRDEERRAFEQFVDFVMERWQRHAGLHIYHYAPYEPSALRRLMGRYATREDELDRMLRGGLFVDLYTVTRQGVRASVESYSIKNLEVFCGFERPVALADARQALATLQACIELDRAADITEDVKKVVVGYNRDDCVSALRLRDWLEQLRSKLVADGVQIERPPPKSAQPSEDLDERQRKLAALVQRLTADVPADKVQRTPEQHARWILANTLDWHRREDKSTWWEYYRLEALPAGELFEERAAIAGLEFVGAVASTGKTPTHRYRFPPQETELRGEVDLHMAGGGKLGSLASISFEDRAVDIKKRKDTADVHPSAVFAHEVVRVKELAAALLRIGEHVAEKGFGDASKYIAAQDLLLRTPPRLGNEPIRRPTETPVEAAKRVIHKLPGGVLPIQGPPGAGKTFTGARMICSLVAAGRRVGVTANSHKVIRKLLDDVVVAADELKIALKCVQKVKDDDDHEDDLPRLSFTTDNATAFGTIQSGECQVAAGTAWFWARPEAADLVDVLFVDEAAQMSLANVLAVSHACKTLVLLGDPQQLDQPMKGSHPEGTDVSALDHLLAGKQTIGPNEGLFLEETWRLPPDICAFTSELFYEGRLQSHAWLQRQVVRSKGSIQGSGLRYLPVEHTGNQNASPEEADRIRELVNEILEMRSTWINAKGEEQPITLKEILIIAPYNAQVFELQERLPGARIGTVDKFQGQEAPIAIYSMTTSSHADAPRGMEFLYSLNRLNVATSRARCVCVIVGSPRLFEPECKTPRQMELANAFCRYLEIANVKN